MRVAHLLLPCCLVACLPQVLTTADEPIEQAMRSYLAVRFDEFEVTKQGRRVYGLAYDADQEIAIVQNEKLRRLMPNTTFYRTILVTPAYEAPEVPVLLSVSRLDNGMDIRSCIARFWGKPSAKFLGQFEYPRVQSEVEARQFAEGVAELFAGITHEVTIKNTKCSWDGKHIRRVTVEIWGDDQMEQTVELLQLEEDDGKVEQFMLVRDPKRN